MQRKLQVECSKLRKQVETLADLNKQLRVEKMNDEEHNVGKYIKCIAIKLLEIEYIKRFCVKLPLFCKSQSSLMDRF